MKIITTSIPFLCAATLSAQPFVHEVAIDPGRETPQEIIRKAASVVPSERQVAFHELLYTCFIHFGPNTFTGVEWGNGKEDPKVFQPGDSYDPDQWCRVAKEAGMKLMLITVKHHDGFCTYQTRYNNTFSVRATPWKNGRGDVLRDLSAACRKHGLKLGVYLSPADLYQMESADGLYGNGSKPRPTRIPTDPDAFRSDPTKVRTDKPAGAPVFEYQADDYNRYFLNQLYELLTEYGPVSEVWFDGAHPKTKGGQTYMKDEWFGLIRKLAPQAVIFGGPDVRWCGNEAGRTRAAEWNVLPVESLATSGKDRSDDDVGSDAKVTAAEYKVYQETLRAKFLYYLVSEVNTSIRAGWFWRNDDEQGVRSADDVFDIYERAAGGNAVFLLNVPPGRDGLIGARDRASLVESGRRIRQTYGDSSLMKGATSSSPALVDGDEKSAWQAPGKTGEFTITFPAARTFNRVSIREDVAQVGQRVASHALDIRVNGAWQEVATARTIGWQRILRFPAVTTDAIRVRLLDSRMPPAIREVSIHRYQAPPPSLSITRVKDGSIVIAPEGGDAFGWKSHGQKDDSARVTIHYTTDGSVPGRKSPVYQKPFALPDGGRVRAIAVAGELAGPVTETRIGLPNSGWKIVSASSEHNATYAAAKAIDGDPATFWHTNWDHSPAHPHTLVIDLGKPQHLAGFTYLPRQDKRVPDSMIESGEVSTSSDGTTWGAPEPFKFGNLVNDPSCRTLMFAKPHKGVRFVRLVSKSGAAGKPYAGAAEIGLLPE